MLIYRQTPCKYTTHSVMDLYLKHGPTVLPLPWRPWMTWGFYFALNVFLDDWADWWDYYILRSDRAELISVDRSNVKVCPYTHLYLPILQRTYFSRLRSSTPTSTWHGNSHRCQQMVENLYKTQWVYLGWIKFVKPKVGNDLIILNPAQPFKIFTLDWDLLY